MKIRHYGLLANRGRTERLTLCLALLAVVALGQLALQGKDLGEELEYGRACCPACGADQWRRGAEVPKAEAPEAERAGTAVQSPDTS